jgi:hypothetical protein
MPTAVDRHRNVSSNGGPKANERQTNGSQCCQSEDLLEMQQEVAAPKWSASDVADAVVSKW